MEIVLAFGLILAGLVTFDLLAIRFGVDSRVGIGDDHVRRAVRGWI